ncbi:fla cluster protein flaG [Halosegnis marinus]|uniref:Flagellar protein G n=1 Tax=Halosegnis marinus TaxID=3034023 RepID=A0ABD5ZQE5_9EURY|nr:fla cluster protein flaG [Halosegnis sp. DT85]
MASASVSTLVIFIAAVSIAAGVSGAMVTTVGGISDSLDDRGADVARSIDTDVEIISDPGSGAVYDGSDTVTLLVKNTGDRTIETEGTGIEVLVDGRYTTPDSVEVLGGDTAWREGAVVRVTVTRTLDAGDHRATVIVGSERETLAFRVAP